jgi:hypothetical protein
MLQHWHVHLLARQGMAALGPLFIVKVRRLQAITVKAIQLSIEALRRYAAKCRC